MLTGSITFVPAYPTTTAVTTSPTHCSHTHVRTSFPAATAAGSIDLPT
jgi:hypothetical protein